MLFNTLRTSPLISDKLHFAWKCFAIWFTLLISNSKNFRLFQIQGICRWQNHSNSEIDICIRKSRKHWWKRRKCWLPFPTMFLKAFFSRGVKVLEVKSIKTKKQPWLFSHMIAFLNPLRIPHCSVVKCLTLNSGVLGSSHTGSGFFRESVLGQGTSEPSLVLVKPRKTWIIWAVAMIWLKYFWKRCKNTIQSVNLNPLPDVKISALSKSNGHDFVVASPTVFGHELGGSRTVHD